MTDGISPNAVENENSVTDTLNEQITQLLRTQAEAQQRLADSQRQVMNLLADFEHVTRLKAAEEKEKLDWQKSACLLDAKVHELSAELVYLRGRLGESAAAIEGQLSELTRLRQANTDLQGETQRLWEGNFTAAEFHNLCHNMKVDGVPLTHEHVEAFQRGCNEYQQKLFGERCDEQGKDVG